MARKSAVDTVVNQENVENEVLVASVATENMSVEEKKSEEVVVEKVEPLKNSDEIEVVALVDNVTYKDKVTGDFYEWDKAGHTEMMTVETLNNLWRNHKRYFRSMWLRPNDDRVINKFGLESMYAKYDYLMDANNYVRSNMKKISEGISNVPNDLKRTVCDKVRIFVATGKVTDVAVIRAIEKQLNIDLISDLQ